MGLMQELTLSRTPKLILFDLDDTLVGSTRIYKKCYQDLKLDLAVLERAKTEIKQNLGAGHVSAHQRLLYFKKYLEMKSLFSAEVLLEMISQYERRLQDYVHQDWIQLQREDLFLKLKKKFSLALVTNESTRTQLLKLQMLDPEQKIFDFMVTSEEVGVEKPNSKIFSECFRRSSCRIEDVLMVGDSVKNDLEPIAAMGGQVIGTTEFLDDSENGKDFPWIANLNQLSTFLF